MFINFAFQNMQDTLKYNPGKVIETFKRKQSAILDNFIH